LSSRAAICFPIGRGDVGLKMSSEACWSCSWKTVAVQLRTWTVATCFMVKHKLMAKPRCSDSVWSATHSACGRKDQLEFCRPINYMKCLAASAVTVTFVWKSINLYQCCVSWQPLLTASVLSMWKLKSLSVDEKSSVHVIQQSRLSFVLLLLPTYSYCYLAFADNSQHHFSQSTSHFLWNLQFSCCCDLGIKIGTWRRFCLISTCKNWISCSRNGGTDTQTAVTYNITILHECWLKWSRDVTCQISLFALSRRQLNETHEDSGGDYRGGGRGTRLPQHFGWGMQR